MNHMDIRNLASGMAPVVKGYVEQAVAPLQARAEKLENEAEVLRTERDVEIARVCQKLAAEHDADIKRLEAAWETRLAALEAQLAATPLMARIEKLERQLTEEAAARDEITTRSAGMSDDVRGLVSQWDDRFEALEAKTAEAVQKTYAAAAEIEARLSAADEALEQKLAAQPEMPDVSALVEAAVAALPPAKDGAPGLDGKDADPEVMRAMIAEQVAKIPAPQDGKSVTLEDLSPLVAEAVQRAVEALPVAKDGVGVAGAIIDRAGSLIVTLTDGTTRDLGPVVGKDGRDGADGKNGERGEPGFGLDDFDVEVKDERTIVLKFTRGDVLETYELAFPVMIYRGAYKDDQAYERGDTVSRGGNLYHCNAPTTDKPESGSDAWTLSARRGRDGKDGAPGQKGEPGQKGDPGRDARAWT